MSNLIDFPKKCYIKTFKGVTNFVPFDYQIDLLKKYKNNRFNIVKHSRQLGITTLHAIRALHYALSKKNRNILIVSSNRSHSAGICKKIKFLFSKLNSKKKIITNNVFSIEFSNGSVIRCNNPQSMKDAGCGVSIDLLILDNASLYLTNDLWTSVFPAIIFGKTKGRVIISFSSINNSITSLLYNSKNNGFIKSFYNYKNHPDQNNSEFARKAKLSFGLTRFSEDFEASI